MLLRSILDKNSCYCQTHDAEKTILKMTGSQSPKHFGSFINFNRLGQLRIANTTTVAILNQRTNGPVNAHLISWPSKAQNIQNLENIW